MLFVSQRVRGWESQPSIPTTLLKLHAIHLQEFDDVLVLVILNIGIYKKWLYVGKKKYNGKLMYTTAQTHIYTQIKEQTVTFLRECRYIKVSPTMGVVDIGVFSVWWTCWVVSLSDGYCGGLFMGVSLLNSIYGSFPGNRFTFTLKYLVLGNNAKLFRVS